MLVTHNETSTGVTNPLEELARGGPQARRSHDRGRGEQHERRPLPVDEWDLDVVVTGSQKGWMVPPGLAMVSISERAWKAYRRGQDAALLL